MHSWNTVSSVIPIDLRCIHEENAQGRGMKIAAFFVAEAKAICMQEVALRSPRHIN